MGLTGPKTGAKTKNNRGSKIAIYNSRRMFPFGDVRDQCSQAVDGGGRWVRVKGGRGVLSSYGTVYGPIYGTVYSTVYGTVYGTAYGTVCGPYTDHNRTSSCLLP